LEHVTRFGEPGQGLQGEHVRSVHIDFREDRLTSDAGFLALREVLERLGLIAWLVTRLEDPRDQERVIHSLASLLRARLLMLSQGWLDANDVDVLRQDPAFRVAVSDHRGQRPLRKDQLPSVSTMVRLPAMLSSDANVDVLHRALAVLAGQGRPGRPEDREPVVVDFDSLPIEVHGHQPGSAYSGQYGYRAYHPLVATIGEDGDFVGAWLRPGNAHTAHGAEHVIPQTVKWVTRTVAPVSAVRFDAGFPAGSLLDVLEERGIHYVARIRCNNVLSKLAGWSRLPLLSPPTEEPLVRLRELSYKAGSWSRERRIVHISIQEPGELVSRDFFLVTSLTPEDQPRDKLLALYRRRGLAEDNLGQWLGAVTPSLCSTNRPKSHIGQRPVAKRADPVDAAAVNEVHLLMTLLASNLLCVLRRLDAVEDEARPRLTTVRERLLKVGARAVLSARRVRFVIARSSRPRWRWLWARLAELAPSGPLVPDTS